MKTGEYVKLSLESFNTLLDYRRELQEKTIYIGRCGIGEMFSYVKTCSKDEAILALNDYVASQEERIAEVTKQNKELLSKLKNRSWFHRLFNL